jgi:hypothetical protein
LRSDWIRAWLILSLKTHALAPNGELAVPGHTPGAGALETSAELEIDNDLGSGAATGTADTAATTPAANAATAATIVQIAAIRPMMTRRGIGVLPLGISPYRRLRRRQRITEIA